MPTLQVIIFTHSTRKRLLRFAFNVSRQICSYHSTHFSNIKLCFIISLRHRVKTGSGLHPASHPMGSVWGGAFTPAGAWSWPLTCI